jgi:hypothetical protein
MKGLLRLFRTNFYASRFVLALLHFAAFSKLFQTESTGCCAHAFRSDERLLSFLELTLRLVKEVVPERQTPRRRSTHILTGSAWAAQSLQTLTTLADPMDQGCATALQFGETCFQSQQN